MMHRTTVEMDAPDVMRQRMTESVVDLYRRSQTAGDEGRLFLVRRMDGLGDMLQIGLVRTNDADAIANLMKWRDLFHEDIRELEESKLLRGLKSRSFTLAQQPVAHDPLATGYVAIAE